MMVMGCLKRCGGGPAAATPDRVAIQAGIVWNAAGLSGLHHHTAGQAATPVSAALHLPGAQGLLM